MKNIFLIFSMIFILEGCLQKEQSAQTSSEPEVASEVATEVAAEDCETTKVADLEKEIEQKQETAFDLTGSQSNTGCTLDK